MRRRHSNGRMYRIDLGTKKIMQIETGFAHNSNNDHVISADGKSRIYTQPSAGLPPFREFLDKHGNGVHYIGFEVGQQRDAVIHDLQEAGYDVNRTLGIYPGRSWTIVDSEDVLGVNLNIKPVR